ncbi:hypothetical protein H6P81_018696 [Aristolochia fimbriata]|uniref:Ribosomal protein L2 n=1 Tax=Aristolochia fimbriata TaxID=158543 RepID=A0AAV7E5V4_ARIFI|nr:hypothetical protein H6P81_018696 [Aristolochia fimbriata]
MISTAKSYYWRGGRVTYRRRGRLLTPSKFPESIGKKALRKSRGWICPYGVNEELQLIRLNVNGTLACFDVAEKTIHPIDVPLECAEDDLMAIPESIIHSLEIQGTRFCQ